MNNTLPLSNVHEVRQFLGLCYFFHCHVRNFAQLSAPLTTLTKKAWKGGLLLPDTMLAFQELETVCAQNQKSSILAVITHVLSLLVPASETKMNPVASGPFLRNSILIVNIASLPMPVTSYSNMSAIPPYFFQDASCNLGYGLLCPYICNVRNSRSSWTTDL